jgi:hypothetical protein
MNGFQQNFVLTLLMHAVETQLHLLSRHQSSGQLQAPAALLWGKWLRHPLQQSLGRTHNGLHFPHIPPLVSITSAKSDAVDWIWFSFLPVQYDPYLMRSEAMTTPSSQLLSDMTYCVRSEVLAAAFMDFQFCDLTPCILNKHYFGGACCLHFQFQDNFLGPEEERRKVLRNFGNWSVTVSFLRRFEYTLRNIVR